jgi:hypothetical protein
LNKSRESLLEVLKIGNRNIAFKCLMAKVRNNATARKDARLRNQTKKSSSDKLKQKLFPSKVIIKKRPKALKKGGAGSKAKNSQSTRGGAKETSSK